MGLELLAGSIHTKVSENLPNFQLRATNMRLMMGVMAFLIYLLIGAAMFSTIEHPVEVQMVENLRKLKDDFRQKHQQCISCKYLLFFLVNSMSF